MRTIYPVWVVLVVLFGISSVFAAPSPAAPLHCPAVVFQSGDTKGEEEVVVEEEEEEPDCD